MKYVTRPFCDFKFFGRLPRTGYYFRRCMMVWSLLFT